MEKIETKAASSQQSDRQSSIFTNGKSVGGPFPGAYVSVFIILLGMLGVLTILYQQASQVAISLDNSIALTANRNLEAPVDPNWYLSHSTEEPGYVKIDGEKVAGNPIQMTFDSFDPQAKYQLHLGNGIRQSISTKNFEVLYNYPGVYYPIMEVFYRDEAQKVPLPKVWIR
ncbi:MAG: hypothetical protein HKN16_07750 [Saprospiraceae bacterium]|nr:hypothetical protein [Saprospiraceae bacterium]